MNNLSKKISKQLFDLIDINLDSTLSMIKHKYNLIIEIDYPQDILIEGEIYYRNECTDARNEDED